MWAWKAVLVTIWAHQGSRRHNVNVSTQSYSSSKCEQIKSVVITMRVHQVSRRQNVSTSSQLSLRCAKIKLVVVKMWAYLMISSQSSPRCAHPKLVVKMWAHQVSRRPSRCEHIKLVVVKMWAHQVSRRHDVSISAGLPLNVCIKFNHFLIIVQSPPSITFVHDYNKISVWLKQLFSYRKNKSTCVWLAI